MDKRCKNEIRDILKAARVAKGAIEETLSDIEFSMGRDRIRRRESTIRRRAIQREIEREALDGRCC